MAKYSTLVAHVDFPSTLLPKWQKHLAHKLHSQPHLPMETISYGEAWRAFNFESKILGYVQELITRLCPLHVHNHGFIVHNHFIMINYWSAVHYDISLREIPCNDISWWYIVLFCEISLQQSLARTISRRDITNIVPISRWFIVLTFGNSGDVSLIYRR